MSDANEPPDGIDAPGASSSGGPPWWRSPWVWGFVIGAFVLTSIRPFLRRVPPPPPGLAPLAEVTWTTEQGAVEGWTAVDADAIAVVLVPEAVPGPVTERARKVALAWETTDTRRRAVVLLGASEQGCDAKALRRLARATATPSSEWRWGCLDADAWSVVDGAFGDTLPSDRDVTEVIAVVDAAGWLRAVCDATTDEVVSEVWHRSGHVVVSPVVGSPVDVASEGAEMDENSP